MTTHRDPESVWDYPRPPAARRVRREVRVTLGGVQVVATGDVVEVLETSHPPTLYLPRSAFAAGTLVPAAGCSWCEFKGTARYADVVAGGAVARRAAWCYAEPAAGYEPLRGRFSLYPGRMDECLVEGERVTAQAGDFYGGWITSWVTGPFKGGPGTAGW